MPEQTLSVQVKKIGDKTYNNLDLKRELQIGNHIVVQKDKYIAGQAIPSKRFTDKNGKPTISYSCKVQYNGEEVSFWLTPTEHTKFEATGGLGDTLQISMVEVRKPNPITKRTELVPTLVFEKV